LNNLTEVSQPLQRKLSSFLSSNIATAQAESNSTKPKILAAVSLVIVQTHPTKDLHDCQLLLMQRAFHKDDPWSGHLSFPGGGIEKEDENTLATAIRETQEEMGLTLSMASWSGALSPVFGPVISEHKTVQLFPHIFVLDAIPELSLNEEAQAAFWVSLNRLSQARYVNEFSHPHIKEKTMLGIDIGKNLDVLLWGLTLEVLYQFFKKINFKTEQDLITYL